MDILILKLTLAPLIIGAASLAGRRWGSTASGLILGLPIFSGPIVLILALSHDAAYAANASLGVLSGGLSLVAYALAFSWLATRFRWPVSLSVGLAIFFSITVILQATIFPLPVAALLVTAAVALGLRLLPKGNTATTHEAKPGRWDIPGRILIGMAFILGITGIAPFIGPRLSGLLTTIPIYVTILAIYNQRLQGPDSVARLFRGLLVGIFAFSGFFVTLIILLERTSIPLAFLAATWAALAIQTCSLVYMQRKRKKVDWAKENLQAESNRI
jgi:hypothetical protein